MARGPGRRTDVAGDQTRAAILRASGDLLQTRGFNAFSYRDVAEAVGIRAASVHYHFPTKEDLGVALVDELRRASIEWARNRFPRGDATAVEKLESFFEYFDEMAEAGSRICAYGILSAEYASLPEGMRESLRRLHRDHQRWLVRVLQQGREDGAFGGDGDVEDQAVLLASGVQGALQIARACGDPERYRAVVRELRRSVVGEPEDE